LKAIENILSATFGFDSKVYGKFNSERFFVSDLIPWTGPSGSPFSMSSLNKTTLINLWLLAQDNEYVLSKILGDSRYTSQRLVFPRILGSCGHFYAVEHSDQILDLSFVTPQSAKFYSQSFNSRVDIAIELIEFLLKFESLRTGLELCDVKFEHFGVFRDSNEERMLLMIDSDMIYHNKTALESIEAISECSDDRDCDFVDCMGICVEGKGHRGGKSCHVDITDNNLRRVCRNMLFMGEFNLMSYQTKFGLLQNPPSEHAVTEGVNKVRAICSDESKNGQMRDRIEIIYTTLKQLKAAFDVKE
jgi:hypothetical protein